MTAAPNQNSLQSHMPQLALLGVALGLMAVGFVYPHFAAFGDYLMTPPPVAPIFKPPVVVPIDVTSPQLIKPGLTGTIIPTTIGPSPALNGIQSVSQFPSQSDLKGSLDFLLVRFESGAQYLKPNPYTVELKSGRILVSVKRPSQMAMVKTPIGDVAISANGDVLLSYTDGVLRVANLDGLGQNVMVKLTGPNFKGKDHQAAIAPGFEVIGADRALTGGDLRPKDGIARRHAQTLENGHMAVGEFSIASAMNNVRIIAEMQQNLTGVKERRILGDMSKMAAVLNYQSGTEGYR